MAQSVSWQNYPYQVSSPTQFCHGSPLTDFCNQNSIKDFGGDRGEELNPEAFWVDSRVCATNDIFRYICQQPD